MSVLDPRDHFDPGEKVHTNGLSVTEFETEIKERARTGKLEVIFDAEHDRPLAAKYFKIVSDALRTQLPHFV